MVKGLSSMYKIISSNFIAINEQKEKYYIIVIIIGFNLYALTV